MKASFTKKSPFPSVWAVQKRAQMWSSKGAHLKQKYSLLTFLSRSSLKNFSPFCSTNPEIIGVKIWQTERLSRYKIFSGMWLFSSFNLQPSCLLCLLGDNLFCLVIKVLIFQDVSVIKPLIRLEFSRKQKFVKEQCGNK
jgi:hypothetical protein